MPLNLPPECLIRKTGPKRGRDVMLNAVKHL